MILLGEEDLESLLLVSLDFTFADFALYSFTVINYSHEEDSMLSAVNPPSQSLNLEEVSGTSQHTPLVAAPQN